MSDVRLVEPGDRVLLRGAFDIAFAASGRDRPWSGAASWASARGAWVEDTPTESNQVLVCWDGDRLVGAARLTFPRSDNTHLLELLVYVDPAHVRRGFGSALVATAFELGRAAGRTTVFTEAAGDLSGAGPGVDFARSCGFEIAQQDIMKRLSLHAVDWDGLVAAGSGSAGFGSAGHRLVTWVDRCPSEHVDAYCRLLEAFLVEIPLGELDIEAEKWGAARLAETESRHAATGTHTVVTMSLAADGSASGYTELMVRDDVPEMAMQEGTLVLGAHRGLGLGLRLKAVNHRAFAEAFPQARFAITGNAVENEHMSAVNERLGYVAFERSVELQARL